ncbi:unnamed protein product [Sphagnum balticum]
MRNNLVDVDAHQFKNHIVHCHGNNVSNRLFDLNVEHGDERPDQRLDMCVLLREQQRPPLQEGERDVDQVNGRRDRVGDNPPLVCRQNLKTVLLGVVDQLAPILLVECEQSPEVDPTLHRIRLLIGLLGNLASDHNGHIHVVITVITVTFIELLVVSKEQVVNDRFDDASANDELERVRGQVHVRVQHVGVLYLAIKVGLLLGDQQQLIKRPGCPILPYVMATVLAREEQLGEVLDVEALLALVTNNANLHLIATLVNTELAPAGHITVGRHQNDLDGVRQVVLGLVWHGLSQHFCCNP